MHLGYSWLVIAVWDGLSTSVDETIYILAFGSFGLQGVLLDILEYSLSSCEGFECEISTPFISKA